MAARLTDEAPAQVAAAGPQKQYLRLRKKTGQNKTAHLASYGPVPYESVLLLQAQ